ncbi:hypothetical protein DV096_01795 [Bradymonadaceae bacterium TMQ3]|nr:hypothetical protein DV096_01795 [Bradymonadaceae bacterium TMQ3]
MVQQEEPPPQKPDPQDDDAQQEPQPPSDQAIAVELQNPDPAEEEPEDAEFIAEVAQRTDVQMVAEQTTLEDAEAPEPDEDVTAPEQEVASDAPEYLASDAEVNDEELEGAREDEGASEEVVARSNAPSEVGRDEEVPAAQAAVDRRDEPVVEPLPVAEPEPSELAADDLAMRLPADEAAEVPLARDRALDTAERAETSDPPKTPSTTEPQDAAASGVADETLGPARLFGRDMKAYQEVFEERDAERADEIAEARASQRRRLLSGWQGDSAKLRASLQNFVPHVQVGNHTQVNAASAAHATMIARMHRRYIHPQWAEGFVRRIESDLSMAHPLNNLELMARLELVIDGETGEVVDVVRLESSGNEFFDGQAIIVAWNITSVAPVPDEVISHDGRVYIHWEFARGPRLCGTFGARIFKLTEPGSERQLDM